MPNIMDVWFEGVFFSPNLRVIWIMLADDKDGNHSLATMLNKFSIGSHGSFVAHLRNSGCIP